MDLTTFAAGVTIVLALVGLVGALAALAYRNISRETRDLWKDRGDALEARLAEVETAQRECLAREEGTKGRMETLERSNEVLSDQVKVSGTAAVEALGGVLRDQHTETIDRLDAITARLQ